VPLRRDGVPFAFTICGLGKFGGREMGYASDLELIFVHETDDAATDPAGALGGSSFFEQLARQIVDSIDAPRRGIFRIDLRLRPYGDAGPLSTSIAHFRRYYSPAGQAAAFERQALIKLRWVAGDEALGRAVEAHRDAFTYSGVPWNHENALHLRQRQARELVKPGQVNVKYSSGGIVDVEYAVQYLQLLHGRDAPRLRQPNTLAALSELERLRIVDAGEYATLHTSYLFLRNVIDALRIVRGDASDLVLPDEKSEEFKSLARRLGYRDRDRRVGATRLSADIAEQMKSVRDAFNRRFG
jgi:glutamate-ammonia-ligase adenylyltransferase